MSAFAVDLDSLTATASRLRAAQAVVEDWGRRKAELSAAAPVAGSETMASAITQFCDEWSYGFGHLSDDIEQLAIAIEGAVSAYIGTESMIVEGCGG